MELLNIRELFRIEYGLGDSDSFFNVATTNTLINSALTHVSQRHQWPWLSVVDTVDLPQGGSTLNTSPSSVQSVVALLHPDGRPLDRITVHDIQHYLSEPSIPRVYYTAGNGWHVLPAADKDYTFTLVYYRAGEDQLLVDTDEPLLPDRYINMLVNATCVLAARRERDLDRERIFFSAREQAVSLALAEIDQSEEPVRIPRTNKRLWG